MRTSLPLLAVVVLLATPGAAHASRADDYAFEVSVVATGRAGEDASVVQWSITRHTRAKVRVGGRTLRVKVAATTTSGGADTATVLRDARDLYAAGAPAPTPVSGGAPAARR